MKMIDAHAKLLGMREPVFATADAVAHLDLPGSTVSMMLTRLASAGHLVRIRRGLWAIPGQVTALQLTRYLTAPFPSYVSLQSALFHHGLVSQIPDVVYVISPARTRRDATPLGTFSIHHVQPAFFFGYTVLGDGVTRMASPEKALVDFLYLSPARSKLFRSLPELELPRGFRVKQARGMIRRIPSTARGALVRRLFDDLGWDRPLRPDLSET